MRRTVSCWFLAALAALALGPAVPARAGGGRGHQAAPHVSPPKVPHYSAPKAPHFSVPKPPTLRQQTPHTAPHSSKPSKPGPAAARPSTPHPHGKTPKTKARSGAGSGNGTGTAAATTPAHANPASGPSGPAQGAGRAATATASAPAVSEPATNLLAGAVPPGILGLPATPTHGTGYGYAHGLGYGVGRGHGYHHGYHGPYRYGPRNYVAMSPQARNRMRRLQKLIADLDALTPGTAVGPAQRNVLRADLQALSQGSGVYRPASSSVQALAGGLTDALPSRTQPLLNTARLAGDLEVIVNGPHLPAPTVSRAVNDAGTVLRSGGVGRANLQSLANAMRSVGTPGGVGGVGLANRAAGVR